MRTLCCVFLLLFVNTVGARAQATASAGKAIRLMQDMRYAEAAAEFEKSLAADPNNDTVRIQYATCLFALERNADARKQFEIEGRRLGEQPGFKYYLARLDLRANNYASAISRLTPLARNPSFPKASYYLGLALLSNGADKEGLESLELAGQSNPKDVWTLEHGACTWDEWLLIKADYVAQFAGGSNTFNWCAGGSTYSITGIYMRPPQVKSTGDQYNFVVTSEIGQ